MLSSLSKHPYKSVLVLNASLKKGGMIVMERTLDALVLLLIVILSFIQIIIFPFNCLPNIVSRYFCKLLLGLSGIVISMNPCSKAGFK
jgi:hypothetical protein